MEQELTERSRQLLELLMTIPPQLEAARLYLDKDTLSSEEITKVGICYAESCFFEVCDHNDKMYAEGCDITEEEVQQGVVARLHSTYVYEIVELLLPYGLNPNAVYNAQYGQHNIMDAVTSVDNEYLAADTMVLLLEGGGDPNLVVELESIYESVLDDVLFGAFEQESRWRYDSWVHLWMVLLAFGGKVRGRKSKVEVFHEYESNSLFDVKKLRKHRDYYYGISKEDYEPVIHIYDGKTFTEVARY